MIKILPNKVIFVAYQPKAVVARTLQNFYFRVFGRTKGL